MVAHLTQNIVWLSLACSLTWSLGLHESKASTNVYVTHFESPEGYDNSLDLIGQAGWVGAGSGGNGLTAGFITNTGQHAYIGFLSPTNSNEDQLVVWKPIDFEPLVAGLPLVRFSVLLQIADSINTKYDDFRWSFYNRQGNRLFSLDFDNLYLDANYLLDGTNELHLTGIPITNAVTYELVVNLNFASNLWSATINSTMIATNQPITTTNAPLNLGDVDAVWLINDPASPGDNFMVFDDYRIDAEGMTGEPPPPAQVKLLGRTTEGWVLLRVLGQDNTRWSLESSSNFLQWTGLKTNLVSGLSFDFVDLSAVNRRQQFYRARWVP